MLETSECILFMQLSVMRLAQLVQKREKFFGCVCLYGDQLRIFMYTPSRPDPLNGSWLSMYPHAHPQLPCRFPSARTKKKKNFMKISHVKWIRLTGAAGWAGDEKTVLISGLKSVRNPCLTFGHGCCLIANSCKILDALYMFAYHDQIRQTPSLSVKDTCGWQTESSWVCSYHI